MSWCSFTSIFCFSLKPANKRMDFIHSNIKNQYVKLLSSETNTKHCCRKLTSSVSMDACNSRYFAINSSPYGLGKRVIVARPGLVVVRNDGILFPDALHVVRQSLLQVLLEYSII